MLCIQIANQITHMGQFSCESILFFVTPTVLVNQKPTARPV